MTRKKVKLACITNASSRRTSLKKGRLGLLKKVNKPTILCGVNACLIIYSPGENEPMMLPSHAKVKRQLREFYKMSELERLRKMMNQETYFIENVTKAQERMRKYQWRNIEVEMGHFMHKIIQGQVLDELNLTELHGLIWFVKEKMKEIRKCIEFFRQVPFELAGPTHGDFPFPPHGPRYDPTTRISDANAGLGGDGRTLAESLLWDQWFIDIIKNDEFRYETSSTSMVSDIGLPFYHLFAGSTTDGPGAAKTFICWQLE